MLKVYLSQRSKLSCFTCCYLCTDRSPALLPEDELQEDDLSAVPPPPAFDGQYILTDARLVRCYCILLIGCSNCEISDMSLDGEDGGTGLECEDGGTHVVRNMHTSLSAPSSDT